MVYTQLTLVFTWHACDLDMDNITYTLVQSHSNNVDYNNNNMRSPECLGIDCLLLTMLQTYVPPTHTDTYKHTQAHTHKHTHTHARAHVLIHNALMLYIRTSS